MQSSAILKQRLLRSKNTLSAGVALLSGLTPPAPTTTPKKPTTPKSKPKPATPSAASSSQQNTKASVPVSTSPAQKTASLQNLSQKTASSTKKQPIAASISQPSEVPQKAAGPTPSLKKKKAKKTPTPPTPVTTSDPNTPKNAEQKPTIPKQQNKPKTASQPTPKKDTTQKPPIASDATTPVKKTNKKRKKKNNTPIQPNASTQAASGTPQTKKQKTIDQKSTTTAAPSTPGPVTATTEEKKSKAKSQLTPSQRRNRRRKAQKVTDAAEGKTSKKKAKKGPSETPAVGTTDAPGETKKKKKSKKKKATTNTEKKDKATTPLKGVTAVKPDTKGATVDTTNDWATKASAMQEQLGGAQFRWINEKLYTCTSGDAFMMMSQDPELFDAYHKGYRAQVKKWPVNPNDKIIKLVKADATWVVGDFGCGEGKLAESVSNKVHSFDLVSTKPHITACNIAKVPLAGEVLDVAVFSLSLMGTDYISFISEAHRTLKVGGKLIIAEVQSRFETSSVETFALSVENMGFIRENVDLANPYFVFMTFVKTKSKPKIDRPTSVPLKACQYKKR